MLAVPVEYSPQLENPGCSRYTKSWRGTVLSSNEMAYVAPLGDAQCWPNSLVPQQFVAEQCFSGVPSYVQRMIPTPILLERCVAVRRVSNPAGNARGASFRCPLRGLLEASFDLRAA